MKPKYKAVLLFLLLFQGYLQSQTKKESVEALSKQLNISYDEASRYYDFKKNLKIKSPISSLEAPGNKTQSSCSGLNTSNSQNIGFELGNFSDWIVQSGILTNALYDSIINVQPATTTKTILTTGTDPITGLSYNSPFSGNYVAKLNDAIHNTEATFMSTKFVVTGSKNILKTAFSYVHETVGHECSGMPYMRIQLFGCNRNNMIKEYLFIPDLGGCRGYNPGFFNPSVVTSTNGDLYTVTDWKKVCFDLRDHVGEEVEINVIVSDCIYGGHFGYTYFDAEFDYLPMSYSVASSFLINSIPFSYALGVSGQCFNPGSTLQCQNSSGIVYPTSINTNPFSSNNYSFSPVSTQTLIQSGTYDVIETVLPGCEFHKEININIKPTITVSVPSQTFCPNAAAPFTLTGATTYTIRVNNNYSFQVGSISTSSVQAGIPLASTNSTVRVIGWVGLSSCLDSVSVIIPVFPVTTLSLAYTPVVCIGASTIFASGATSYTWNGGTSNSPNFTSFMNGVNNMTVVGTDNLGCETAPSTFSVLGIYSSSPSITPNNNNTLCQGDSLYRGVSGATSYTWSNGFTGCCQYIKPTLTTPTYTVAASGICIITSTFSIPFNVSNGPALGSFTVNVPNYPVCANQNFTVQGVGASVFAKWPTSSGLGWLYLPYASVTNANPAFTATAIDANGCKADTLIPMSLLPSPTLAISGNTALCWGQTATLTASGANSYTWDYFQPGSTYTAYAYPSNFSVTLTGIDNSGCTSTEMFLILVETPGILRSPNISTVCLGQNTFTLSASNLGSGGTYSWSTGATTQSVIVTPTVTTTYSLTVNSSVCGISIYTTTINVNQVQIPPLSYTLNSPILCTNNANTLTVSGADSYSIYTLNNSSSTNTFVFMPFSQYYPYDINVLRTFTNGCSTHDLLTFTVNQSPNVVSSPFINACVGSTVNLTAGGALTYTWSNAIVGNTNIITLSSGSNSMLVMGTGTNGCIGTASIIITGVNPPSITFVPPAPTTCYNTVFTLTATGAWGLIWNDGTLGGAMTSSVTAPTVFSVTGNNQYCIATKTVLVDVQSPSSFSLATSSLCSGDLNTLSYMASPPGGTLFVNGVATNTIYSPGTNTYNVTYLYNDSLNCTLLADTIVTINPKPCVKLVADNYTSCVGSQINFSGTPIGGIYSGANLSGNTLSVPVAGNYTVSYTYTDQNNCSSSVCSEVSAFVCTGINVNSLSTVALYPNPTRNQVTLRNPTGYPIFLKIYNMNGIKVDEKLISNEENEINMGSYTNGLYIFYLQKNDERKFIKVIKE